MPDTGAPHSLPYPAGTDPANVPLDMQELATQVHARLVAATTAAVNDGDAAGGVLAGTYPNPSFAVDMATQAELDAGLALKQNAATSVNDGDAAGGVLSGTFPNPSFA